MDFNAYLQARQFVAAIGAPLDYLILVLGFLLLGACLFRQGVPYRQPLAVATFMSMLGGYLLMAWYHYKIYATLALVNPANNQPVGRWAIPPWVEGEKFYFWALLLCLWIVLSRRPEKAFRRTSYMVLAGFAISAALYSNPFADPLPSFHKEISGYIASAGIGDMQAQMQAFGMTYGRLVGFYNSTYMWIHPPLLFLAYSMFVMSFLGCVFMLTDREGGWEKLAYDYAKPGYIVLTVGMLLGYPWAVEAWGNEPWWYSPKINVTLMMWVLYTAYLHSRLYLHRRRMWHTAALLGILSFVAVVLTYVTTYVLPGVHSVGGP